MLPVVSDFRACCGARVVSSFSVGVPADKDAFKKMVTRQYNNYAFVCILTHIQQGEWKDTMRELSFSNRAKFTSGTTGHVLYFWMRKPDGAKFEKQEPEGKTAKKATTKRSF